MKSFRVALAALAVALSWAVAIAAPMLPGLTGWERGSAYDRAYDVNYEVVAPSTVLKVETFTPREGMAPGVRAFVVTGPESLDWSSPHRCWEPALSCRECSARRLWSTSARSATASSSGTSRSCSRSVQRWGSTSSPTGSGSPWC